MRPAGDSFVAAGIQTGGGVAGGNIEDRALPSLAQRLLANCLLHLLRLCFKENFNTTCCPHCDSRSEKVRVFGPHWTG
jgi:hypothetical protein